MVKTCCVKNCDIAPKANVTCFRFPNNRFLKRKWIDAIGLSSKLTANSTVCIRHFHEDDYDIVRGRPRLKAKVIPSVFFKSDKKIHSQCITEDDVISNETDTDVAQKNVQKDKLSLSEDKTEKTENEGRKELRNENGAGGRNSTETRKEGKTELRDEGSADDLVSRELKSEETRAELNNGDETGSQACNAQVDDGAELLNKSSDEGSKKSSKEGSTENGNKSEEEVEKSGKTKPNGVVLKQQRKEKGYQESFIESTKKRSSAPEDLHKDIEDIIVNYQIKQTRPLRADAAPDVPDVPDAPDKVDTAPPSAGDRPADLPQKTDPIFIEVELPQGDRAGSPRDCLMVLESVQVELDPSSFLDGEPDDCHETVDLADDDDDQQGPPPERDGRADPISLLTSSDEDDVIVQEPHIDTVEVSDETDEDDVPLGRLARRARPQRAARPARTAARPAARPAEPRRGESTVLHVCDACDYTTASKSQFARHRRKHRDDRKFRCHLCEYKARHNMSLIYHLKSHRALSSARRGFRCAKCGFQSDVKAAVLKHVKLCAADVKRHACDRCAYETKRPADLRRHQARRHRAP